MIDSPQTNQDHVLSQVEDSLEAFKQICSEYKEMVQRKIQIICDNYGSGRNYSLVGHDNNHEHFAYKHLTQKSIDVRQEIHSLENAKEFELRNEGIHSHINKILTSVHAIFISLGIVNVQERMFQLFNIKVPNSEHLLA